MATHRAIGLLLALATPALAADPVDVNAAPASTLAALPGIGPDKAAAIVAWRSEHGDFAALHEVARVPGVGTATLKALGPRLTVTGDAPEPGVPAPVDINHADVLGLADLPGVDATLADRIVTDRERLGPYGTCNDLVRVDGIGPATVAVLGPRCTTRP